MQRHRAHRYQTKYPIDFRTPAGPAKGHLINVSSSGARISGLGQVQRGDKIKLCLMSQQIEGIVQWTSGSIVGVAFRPQITADQVDVLRFRRDRSARSRHGSVGFSYAEMR